MKSQKYLSTASKQNSFPNLPQPTKVTQQSDIPNFCQSIKGVQQR